MGLGQIKKKTQRSYYIRLVIHIGLLLCEEMNKMTDDMKDAFVCPTDKELHFNIKSQL